MNKIQTDFQYKNVVFIDKGTNDGIVELYSLFFRG